MACLLLFRAAMSRSSKAIAAMFPVLAASALACGSSGNPETNPRPLAADTPSLSFVLDTVTTCRADGYEGTTTEPTVVTLDGHTITFGSEDEILSGIPLPALTADGAFAIEPMTIETGEMFGEVRLLRARGRVEADSLQLEYEFEVLDVSCRTETLGSKAD
ncbi:MAG: hypothetical protein HY897_24775 [Deltaproteobacteria bacterium]|nr:hypothetical protein [Deltaproteobacteria bacterium]